MPYKKPNTGSGFTLVELSIVLVIIGLLIGGILIGQSLIESAKIQSAIRQLAQYDIAFANFQSKYNGLPGDTSKFPHPGATYEPHSSAGDNRIAYYNESGYVWNHLGLGVNLLDPNTSLPYVAYTPGATTLDKSHCPSLNINHDKTHIPCLAISTRTIPEGYAISPEGKNVYTYQGVAGTNNVGAHSILNAKTVLAMDQKIDDANANTGTMIADPIGVNSCASVSGTYNVSNNNYVCKFYLEVGAARYSK